MKICEDHPKPIVFTDRYCPLCEAEGEIEELKTAIEALEALEVEKV